MTERAEQFDETDQAQGVPGAADDAGSSLGAAEATVSDDDAVLDDDEATGEDKERSGPT